MHRSVIVNYGYNRWILNSRGCQRKNIGYVFACVALV